MRRGPRVGWRGAVLSGRQLLRGCHAVTANSTTERLEFPGYSGAALAARLEIPAGPVRAYALFAHCFTCSKDLLAVHRIAAELARAGIAVLRFDFTGLGASGGDFGSTNFSSNADDLLAAVEYLRSHYAAPSILIGHSLGGAAVLAVAGKVPEVRAVATIGAPSDTSVVLQNFGASLADIEQNGAADVVLAGRRFRIHRQFLDDVRAQRITEAVAAMHKPLLLLHSPVDGTVAIDNAARIFAAAKHPKSFVSLDTADHLLTRPEDAIYAATVIAGWVSRYLPARAKEEVAPVASVHVAETGAGKFQNLVQSGAYRLFADEPESAGGLGSGPSPYDFLCMALGACTSMTLRMYAAFKHLELGRIRVSVAHAKVYARDCAECLAEGADANARIDRFERTISVEGTLTPALAGKLVEIADKCPVHRTLKHGATVATRVVPAPEAVTRAKG